MEYSLKLLPCLFLYFYLTAKMEASDLLKCTKLNATNECPANSACNAINSTANANYQCECLPNFIRNPLWQQNNTNNITDNNNNNNNNSNNNSTYNNNNNSNASRNHFNISMLAANAAEGEYCLMAELANENATAESNMKVYVRQPAKVEHLAFGILMVLFVAIVAIVALYLLKVLRPIKRSRAVYTQLKRRRENRQRLEEFSDDICMIQLNER